ncbi:NAD-dependent epimerase/dehydratase family protein [Parvularcula maris]|uniref:NAD-dependent epimerase/dehydratase family protein n=1 Tax=Parvularcula maris TaxID=2965077 RepID=A0A9X2L674_9PROT|nr:NAD-dependent epimerase/dehydratase family protein [Parvularcula maris]MCQ8183786.1 NAD-dependent epimerase/dehydratase family protein [Parvularcula maris]
MRVLVTGGAGFLGQHVCRLLGEGGHEAVSLDLKPSLAASLSIEGSVLDEASFEAAGKVDAVIHAAALTHLWRRDVRDFRRVNLGGTVQAARHAARHDARFVYVSSYTVHGGKGLPPVVAEDDLPRPGTLFGPYAQSKRAAETALRELLPKAVVVRPSALIGPGGGAETPPMRMLGAIARGELPGTMKGRIDVADVRDVAAGVVSALLKGGEARDYLLTGHDLTLAAFSQKVAKAAGQKPPKILAPPAAALMAAHVEELIGKLTGREPQAVTAGVRMAALSSCFSPARAEAELGYRRRPLGESITDALASLGHSAEA